MYWNIIIFLVGLGVGILVSKILPLRQTQSQNGTTSRGDAVSEKVEEKEKNLDKIREYLAGKEKVTNEEIQELLKVSDATVARYFNELEAEGKIKQFGESGQSVYYKVIK